MKFDFCAVCGEDRVLEQHHFVPKSLGGGDEDTNMLTLCPTHHSLLHQYIKGIFKPENKNIPKVDTKLSSPPQKEVVEGKIFAGKEFIYDNQKDVYIYQDNRTKSKTYYIRIYNEKLKKHWSKSLRTCDRIDAISKARKIYSKEYPF